MLRKPGKPDGSRKEVAFGFNAEQTMRKHKKVRRLTRYFLHFPQFYTKTLKYVGHPSA